VDGSWLGCASEDSIVEAARDRSHAQSDRALFLSCALVLIVVWIDDKERRSTSLNDPWSCTQRGSTAPWQTSEDESILNAGESSERRVDATGGEVVVV
jgi:hypothetical protein